MGRLLALAAALIVATLIAWLGERPPELRGAAAPATAFSAGRAMADVTAIASVPHPMGSPANQRARDHLVARMAALGLSPQVRRDNAVTHRVVGGDTFMAGGAVENIVGVLPGRDRTAPAVALMAHYDSVPGSPGAADDAAGVAAGLEAVRAIKARGIPARDVLLVMTDGEESGLLGANAFFKRDPLARRIGFLLNMEARGAAGRVQMFQAGAGNGETVELLRRTAVRPAASSLSGFIYEKMPNDTDFTESDKVGVLGLNYAFLGRQFDYHSPTATPANLDRGTLQDLGDQVLSTAADAAFAPVLPRRSPDVVYGQVFGDLMLAYPPAVGWLILLVAAALIAVAVVRARRVESFPWIDPLRGAGATVYAVTGAAAVLHFARLATGAEAGYLEQRWLLAQVTRWEVALILLGLGFLIFAAAELARGRRLMAALVPLAAGLASCALAGELDKVGLGAGAVAAVLALVVYGRPITRPGAWTGVLAISLALALAAQALAPPTAFVFAWPLLLAALAAAASAMGAHRGYAALTVITLLAAVALGWIGGVAHVAFLSLDLAELLALPLWLAAAALWPLAQPEEGAPPARRVGPALMVLGLGVLVAIRFVEPWDARNPQVSYVGYNLDQDTGRAWRISAAPDRTAWSDAVLSADGGAVAKRRLWFFSRPVDAAPARPIHEAAPKLTLSRQPDGTLVLHAAPPPGARVLSLHLRPDTPTTVAGIGGIPTTLPLNPGRWTRLRWEASPAGVDLVLRPGGPGKLEVRYAATFERWPAGAAPLPQRPANLMPFDLSDSTVVTGTRRFAW